MNADLLKWLCRAEGRIRGVIRRSSLSHPTLGRPPRLFHGSVWGSRTSARPSSGSVLVFVDQSTEDLCSTYHATGQRRSNCANVSWRSLLERAMRSMSVVVRRVLGQHMH